LIGKLNNKLKECFLFKPQKINKMGETLVWKMKINKEKISINKKMEIISKNNYIKIHTFSLNQKINKNK
jgi:hypothetical protein